MLSNADFAALLSGGGGDGGDGGKKRFDLATVSKWERQNKKGLKRKGIYDDDDEDDNEGGGGSSKPLKPKAVYLRGKLVTADPDAPKDGAPAYRDRAQERRQDVAGEDELVRMEAVASTLDVEQSKFLGGDVAHTHLVKAAAGRGGAPRGRRL